MSNLSQEKRERMLNFLETIKKEKKDDEWLIAINEIENELNSKKYGLVWEKHEEAVDAMMRTHVPVFTEVKEKEIHTNLRDENYNFLLEGDNLHSLKLLEKTHKNRIDVIYIDPPYNTGNNKDEFIYDDHYVDGNDDFKHSKWLSFMSERLRIARNLLSLDGVIIISIGYQEVNNLMLLCNEIFDNKQIVCATVQTSGGKPNGGFNISQEYIVFITPKDFSPNVSEDFQNTYSSPYHGMNLATFNQEQRPNQAYPIFVDENGLIIGYGKSLQDKVDEGSYQGNLLDYKFDYSEAPEGAVAVFPVTTKGEPCVWRLVGSRLMSDWEKGYIKVVPINSKKTNNKYTIQYLSAGVIAKIESGELETYKPKKNIPTLEVKEYKTAGATIPTVWLDKSYHTSNGNNELKAILGGKEFTYPKPLNLIKEILRRVTNEDSIVLDFFAGSGTTGQAVLELNEIDGFNRHFILCTNNEAAICQKVTYQRIKKIIEGYSYEGKKEEILFSKKLNYKDLDSIQEILDRIESLKNENKDKYSTIKPKMQDGEITLIGALDATEGIEGIPANLKYFTTEFIVKSSEDDFYSVEEELSKHIKEMIELERGISIDNDKYLLVLSDDEMDLLEKNPQKLKDCKAVYLSGEVLLTQKQEAMLNGIETIIIPKYYFEDELMEVGEL